MEKYNATYMEIVFYRAHTGPRESFGYGGDSTKWQY